MAIPAFANSAITLTFGGLSNGEQALSYFSGAYGSLGSGPGPNYQITFSPNAIVAVGTKGNMLTGGSIVMNVHTEFANSVKLSYAGLAPEVVDVWSGYDGTGSLLATMTLMPNGSCHSVTQCGWAQAGESFTGIAASVTFSGADGKFGIGSIELGAPYRGKAGTIVTPEPSSIVLVPTGFVGLIWIYMRRKRSTASAFALNRRDYLAQ